VPQYRRELSQSWIENIVLTISLIEVHIRAAHTTGVDLDERFTRPGLGVRNLSNFELGMSPYVETLHRLARSLLEV